MAAPGIRVRSGVVTALAGVGALSAALVPLRAHLSVATTALVLVVPVVAAAALGGFPAGVVGVLAGFLAYDFFFIPPYETLSVGASQNWTALAVYVLVMLMVSWVVAELQHAREVAAVRERDARRLFEISDLLIGGKAMEELLHAVVTTVRQLFALRSTAVLLPGGEGMVVAAAAGEAIPDGWLARVSPRGGVAMSVAGAAGFECVPLVTAAGPLGLLVLVGDPLGDHERRLLSTFANHAALAVQRQQLEEQAVRSRVLEGVDRWRSALIGSVSHDLRTPLGSIKASVSTLSGGARPLADAEQRELLATIEAQTDRLTRLVTNLLDMTRIEAGRLEARRQPVAVRDLVRDALATLGAPSCADVRVEIPAGLPPAAADPTLAGQVLANLIDNAGRHARSAAGVEVTAVADGDYVRVTVADRGPGIAPERRQAVFEPFHRLGRPAGAGMGLGLAISKAFVEAQGGTIEVADNPGGGTLVCFSLPVYPLALRVP